ncbi:MAG: hypothetical protein JWQ00_2678, partial [Noviherbaspirillum sp.]|nr:hypothetical protein [Noviherbaspirillum sp.]
MTAGRYNRQTQETNTKEDDERDDSGIQQC